MNLNLDQILERLRPRPMSLTIDGKDYKLRRLTIADAAQMEEVGNLTGEEFQKRITDYFDGEAPACIARLSDETLSTDERIENEMTVAIVRDAIAALYLANVDQKKRLAMASQMLQVEREKLAAAGTSSSSG